MFKLLSFFVFLGFCLPAVSQDDGFRLNEQEYFENGGVDVMAFQDYYPEGHQGGVAVIMHGKRLATNGDLRLNVTPGQWQPIPRQADRRVIRNGNLISVDLVFPDSSRNRKGYNPIIYPDLYFNYQVNTRAEGNSIIVTVNLDRPLPDEFSGTVGFNLELFPGWLFGKSWWLGNQTGIFNRQPNGPAMTGENGDPVAASPMASGKKLVVAPEDDLLRMTIESRGQDLKLLDGRYMHNNGWFVVRSLVSPGKTEKAVEWVITPHVIPGWMADPVIHVSQVGYHPVQPKTAIVELDRHDTVRMNVELVKMDEDGSHKTVLSGKPADWGRFLRYNYLAFDFSPVKTPGMYFIRYGNERSQLFRIADDVYARNVWQPTLEYFLPVQMCHMRVNEKYRVWHGLCHLDDARMAPVNHNHFDGYSQGSSTMTRFAPGDHVPGLNTGGWHDAGDYDLRVESQSGTVYMLTQIYEAFHPDYDETTINQESKVVEIHQPDGKPDILQQIEHGALSVVSGYQSLGRLYRGIIAPNLREYVLLGDGVNMTDGLVYHPNPEDGEKTTGRPLFPDDRWVFTEDNPSRELRVAAYMAAASRVLKGFNDTLANRCLGMAGTLFNELSSLGQDKWTRLAGINAAIELYLSTTDKKYLEYLVKNEDEIVANFGDVGWMAGKILPYIKNSAFKEHVLDAARAYASEVEEQGGETPFGVPYRPRIWGAGWEIQRFGVNQYFLHEAFPDIYSEKYVYSALNFILGVHPGSNTSSFASGVGAKSATVAYGVNRADWSYIPGGVVSGTALIRPDFPELLDWPYLWQQQEYVMGGGGTNYMFLVLAAEKLAAEKHNFGK